MNAKIKKLLAINGLLLSAIVVSIFLRSSTGSGHVSEESPFVLLDTALVDKIVLGPIELTKKGENRWVLNGKFEANPGRVRSLLALMTRLEIKRPVPQSLKQEVADSLENGISLEVFSDDALLKSMKLGRAGGETVAQLEGDPVGESAIFALYIQGYAFDLYGFFDVPAKAWRDTRILYTTWRSLQELEMIYPSSIENSFKIVQDSMFFKIEGLQRVDTEKVEAYLYQFQGFEVDAFLEESLPLRDSLARMTPFCAIRLSDVFPERNNQVAIYLMPGQRFIGISQANGNELVSFDKQMLANFLVSRTEFVLP